MLCYQSIFTSYDNNIHLVSNVLTMIKKVRSPWLLCSCIWLLQTTIDLKFNPIPHRLKYNLFHAGRGIYAPRRDFALVEPIMHLKIWHFIHTSFEQFVCHRKRQQHFSPKYVDVAAKRKNLWRKMCGQNVDRFKTLL